MLICGRWPSWSILMSEETVVSAIIYRRRTTARVEGRPPFWHACNAGCAPPGPLPPSCPDEPPGLCDAQAGLAYLIINSGLWSAGAIPPITRRGQNFGRGSDQLSSASHHQSPCRCRLWMFRFFLARSSVRCAIPAASALASISVAAALANSAACRRLGARPDYPGW
jgi:hypothetical protein